jgi:hypothetical protein
MVRVSNLKGVIPQPLQYSQEEKYDSSRIFQHNAAKCLFLEKLSGCKFKLMT